MDSRLSSRLSGGCLANLERAIVAGKGNYLGRLTADQSGREGEQPMSETLALDQMARFSVA
jgi:hypothetical protein